MGSAAKEAEDSGGKKRGMQRAAVGWESGAQEGATRLGSPRDTQETAPAPGLVLLRAAGTQQNLAGRVLRNRGYEHLQMEGDGGRWADGRLSV